MARYPKEVEEFIRVRMEQTPNNAQIARDVVNKFGLDRKVSAVRMKVSDMRDELKIESKRLPIKRLFFDIETGYHIVRLFQIGKVGYVGPEKIIKPKRILCISYKWQYEDEVHSLDWRLGERNVFLGWQAIGYYYMNGVDFQTIVGEPIKLRAELELGAFISTRPAPEILGITLDRFGIGYRFSKVSDAIVLFAGFPF